MDLFNLYTEYIMQHARLDEAQAGIKISGRNINNLKYADNTTFFFLSFIFTLFYLYAQYLIRSARLDES